MKCFRRYLIFFIVILLTLSLAACGNDRPTVSMLIEAEKDEDGYDLLPVQIEVENLTSESNFYTVEIAKGSAKEGFSSDRDGTFSVLYLPLNRLLTVKFDGESREVGLDTHFYFLENKEMDGLKVVNGDYYFYLKEKAKSATLRLVYDDSSWKCEFSVQR